MVNLSGTAADLAWRPRGDDPWRRGLGLALAAHVLLVAALTLGVQWRTQPTEVVEAEMWAAIPAAAPAARMAPPEPVVPPEPVPPPVRPVEPEPPAEPVRPDPVPDLVIDKPPVKVRPRPEPQEVWEPPKPKPRPKPQPVPKDAPRPEPKARPEPRPSPSPATEKARQEQLARMMADLGGSSLSSSAGAAGSPGAEYAGRIKARIRPNVVFTEQIAGNPLATVEVRSAPDGRIISRRLLKSSGLPSWDDAVIRAIDRTEVLPLDERGRIPPVMQLDFRPKD